MAEILDRNDLSLYVIAGVPRSFKKTLETLVAEESKQGGDVMLVADDFAEWVVARLQDEKRPRKKRTDASRALWRAYSSLSAARYYLQNESAEEEQVRELRRRVEDLWREVSPMFDDETPSSS